MRMWIAVIAAVLTLVSSGQASSQPVVIIPAKPNYAPHNEWQQHYDNAADMFDLYYQAVNPAKVTATMEFNRLYSRVGVIEHYPTGELITFPTIPLKMKRVNGRFVSHNLLISRGV